MQTRAPKAGGAFGSATCPKPPHLRLWVHPTGRTSSSPEAKRWSKYPAPSLATTHDPAMRRHAPFSRFSLADDAWIRSSRLLRRRINLSRPPPRSSPRSLLLLLLILSNDIHPNPGPRPPTPRPPRRPRIITTERHIVQFNCNGLKSSLPQLTRFLQLNKTKVALIQETKLLSRDPDPVIPNYALIRRDRPCNRGGGGLALYVHHSVKFQNLDTSFNSDPNFELQGIKAKLNNSTIDIYNVYVPPQTSCRGSSDPLTGQITPYRFDISPLLAAAADGDALIGGD